MKSMLNVDIIIQKEKPIHTFTL